jgi:hypothetical protein
MPSDMVTAYLSHSYRHDDRHINEFFWKLSWANGITFAVDPESESLSIPYLELMMKRSAAFVGIVTRRPEQQTYQCSPFMVFEHGLAVQAQKPRLLFVESGVSKYFFPESPETLYFSRQRLPEMREEAQRKIAILAERSDARVSALGHGLGKAGILIDDDNNHRNMIHGLIQSLGFSPVSLDTSVTDTFRFALQLDELDFIVLDLQCTSLPVWLYPFISGRFIPTIKLRAKNSASAGHVPEPPWETGELLESVAEPEEIAVWYKTSRDLRNGLATHVSRLREERIFFRSLGDGTRYFRSLGRRYGKIFISNTSEANDFVRELSTSLKRENIPHFQYRYQNDIELAALWRDELPKRVQESDYFLPLITDHYWQSQFCVEEYEIARERAREGKMIIIPYFLGQAASTNIPEQGRDLSGLSPREQVRRITSDLDAMLIADSASAPNLRTGHDR